MTDCSLACFVQLGINARTPQPRPDVEKVYTQQKASAVTNLGLWNPSVFAGNACHDLSSTLEA